MYANGGDVLVIVEIVIMLALVDDFCCANFDWDGGVASD